jgi:hypothetical protein
MIRAKNANKKKSRSHKLREHQLELGLELLVDIRHVTSLSINSFSICIIRSIKRCLRYSKK